MIKVVFADIKSPETWELLGFEQKLLGSHGKFSTGNATNVEVVTKDLL